jgi:hypothetical protein
MTDHPITPPPELVQQWKRTAPHQSNEHEHYYYITLCAAQWGADQELEACCEWVSNYLPYLGDFPMPEDKLRAARRPKSPSLKEQAFKLLECYGTSGVKLTADQCNTILRALEDSNG